MHDGKKSYFFLEIQKKYIIYCLFQLKIVSLLFANFHFIKFALFW